MQYSTTQMQLLLISVEAFQVVSVGFRPLILLILREFSANEMLCVQQRLVTRVSFIRHTRVTLLTA